MSRSKNQIWDLSSLFFFNDTATTEIYTLSLHDALPISFAASRFSSSMLLSGLMRKVLPSRSEEHTSEPSHANISYAAFCLKKKKQQKNNISHNKKHNNKKITNKTNTQL